MRREHDWFVATALAVRDHIVDRWMDATRKTYRDGRKRVYYLSLEFLIGRLLRDALGNLGLTDDRARGAARSRRRPRPAARARAGRRARQRRPRPARRLLHGKHGDARHSRPRLRHPLRPRHLPPGDPRRLAGRTARGLAVRPAIRGSSSGREVAYAIGFGGTVESIETDDGTTRYRVGAGGERPAVAYDTPIVGWRGRHVNTLRLWSARAIDPIRLDDFNRGDHVGALADRVRPRRSRACSTRATTPRPGQELRLRQEYFFASASLQDLAAPAQGSSTASSSSLADKVAIQLNDTHPAIAVAELMRLLVDVHGMPWELAWDDHDVGLRLHQPHAAAGGARDAGRCRCSSGCCRGTCRSSTSSTRCISTRSATPGHDDDAILSSISLIDENDGRRVRMGHLAFVGSHRVNGVSALHTELMRKTVFRDLHALYPGPHRQQDQRHHVPPLALSRRIPG